MWSNHSQFTGWINFVFTNSINIAHLWLKNKAEKMTMRNIINPLLCFSNRLYLGPLKEYLVHVTGLLKDFIPTNPCLQNQKKKLRGLDVSMLVKLGKQSCCCLLIIKLYYAQEKKLVWNGTHVPNKKWKGENKSSFWASFLVSFSFHSSRTSL